MARLRTVLGALGRRREKAMGLFLTNGFPNLDATVPLLRALEAGGADFIEIGMPFSDPLAEGPPIQRSSARALAGGVRMEDVFRTARAFREKSETPLLLMGYINPILQFGVGNFCAAAYSSGIDGLIIPDLPPGEAGLITASANEFHLDTVFLLAPNTPDVRARKIDQLSTGFVYAVSVTGITGARLEHRMEDVTRYLKRASRIIERNPLLVGFGIKTHADARRLCQYADGFIVGSALVQVIEDLWNDSSLSITDRLEGVRHFATNLATGIPGKRLAP